MWKRIIQVIFYLSVFFSTTTSALNCVKTGPCKCDWDDDSGSINLKGIPQHSSNQPRFKIPLDYYTYSYNPCVGFSADDFVDLAILQSSSYDYYDLGIQANETFNFTEATGLGVHYVSADGQRTSRVNLICNRNLPIHIFQFVGELIIKEYDFILEGPCACAGGCDDNGIVEATESPPQLEWKVVGYDLVSLIFHDLILLFVIVITCLILTHMCGFTLSCCSRSSFSSSAIDNPNFYGKSSET